MGWIRIDKKLLDEAYYFGEPFDRTHCWLDLLLLAETKQRQFCKRGQIVTVERGQVAASLKELSSRWCLAINTVRTRLAAMVDDGRIAMQKSNLITIITICKYEAYQTVTQQTDTPAKTEPQPQQQAEPGAQPDTPTPASDEEENKIFQQPKMAPYVLPDQDKIKKEMLHDVPWQECMCMRFHVTKARLPAYLDSFFLDVLCRGKQHVNTADAKQHFNDWLRIQLYPPSKNNNDATKQNNASRRRGLEVTATTPEEYKTTF